MVVIVDDDDDEVCALTAFGNDTVDGDAWMVVVVDRPPPPGIETEPEAEAVVLASKLFPTDGPRRKSRGLLLSVTDDGGLGRFSELGLRLAILVMA